MYTAFSPLFGIFVSRNCKYINSEMKNKHSKINRSAVSRPIRKVKVLINDITIIQNI